MGTQSQFDKRFQNVLPLPNSGFFQNVVLVMFGLSFCCWNPQTFDGTTQMVFCRTTHIKETIVTN
jgi:hypothetical protein